MTQKKNEKVEEKKYEQRLNPNIETQIQKSKDGKWIIHRTIITDIKPVGYFEKVLA